MTRGDAAMKAITAGYGKIERDPGRLPAVRIEEWAEGERGDFFFAQGEGGAVIVDLDTSETRRLFRTLPAPFEDVRWTGKAGGR